MTEKEFWVFLENSWRDKGRAAQISGIMDTGDPILKSHGEYIGGHGLLPNDCDKISEENIVKMGALLFEKNVRRGTKEAVMVILAHVPSKTALNILRGYNKRPDKGLEIFAMIALDECAMWNE